MKTHHNIPFFIPHAGCPNNCVFCSQTKITGSSISPTDISDELDALEHTVTEALSTLNDSYNTELAFFGGSFTGIEPERMIALLKKGNEYITQGLIRGIRISTRPDYIDSGILDLLSYYGVTSVELGMQSMNDRVLTASGRGHTAECAQQAAKLVKERGFSFVGQMMIGLPESDIYDELYTADKIIELNADGARIYPTVVFEGTPLYKLCLDGLYTPLTVEEAVERSAQCLMRFADNDVSVLRIGLHSSENLAKAPFGANHPALGELVEGRLYLNKIKKLLNELPHSESVTLFVKEGEQSKAAGHCGVNKQLLLKEYALKSIKIKGDEHLKKYEIKLY